MKLPIDEIEQFLKIYFDIRETGSYDLLRDKILDLTPKNCEECDYVYCITSKRIRCNMIIGENVIESYPSPHPDCPYSQIRKILNK